MGGMHMHFIVYKHCVHYDVKDNLFSHIGLDQPQNEKLKRLL